MELHAHFDETEPPQRQQSLKAIPSSDLVIDSPEIKAAIESYEQALANEHQARQDAVQAEQDLGGADHLDAVALADAIAAGKKDPGDENRQKQLAAIQETRRRHQATVILLQRAVDDVNATFAEHGTRFEADLRESREELRKQMGVHLDRFALTLTELRRNSASLAIGQRETRLLQPSAFMGTIALKPGREQMSPEEILAMLRALGAPRESEPQGPQHRRAPHHAHPNIATEIEQDPEATVLTAQRRAERMARKVDRAGERQARREADNEALERVR